MNPKPATQNLLSPDLSWTKGSSGSLDPVQESLIKLMETHLTPIAKNWGYRDTPMEESIKGPPMVLILGNYSSGKSTLINDLLGQEVQKTGQAPTDDSFTVLAYGEPGLGGDAGPLEQEGQMLLQNEALPFSPLKKHGQKFAAHFRLKKVAAPFLKNLMLIDTPGMIDSIAERDRGYNYQSVIHDLAQLADLVLVLFDPHKAGTLRESYESLRETLPQATFENRIVFVLNRIDECQTLADLLRVYGVLCWNLSQMLGRKDIPPIRISYSHRIQNVPDYLKALDDERTHLGELIASAPRLRQDHLRAFARLHGERLHFLLKTLSVYKKNQRQILFKSFSRLSLAGFVIGIGLFLWMLLHLSESLDIAAMVGGLGFGATLGFWGIFVRPWSSRYYHKKALRYLDQWVPVKNQNDQDTWREVKQLALEHLSQNPLKLRGSALKKDLKTLEYLLADGFKV